MSFTKFHTYCGQSFYTIIHTWSTQAGPLVKHRDRCFGPSSCCSSSRPHIATRGWGGAGLHDKSKAVKRPDTNTVPHLSYCEVICTAPIWSFAPLLSGHLFRTCLVPLHVSVLMFCPEVVAVGRVLPWIVSDMLVAQLGLAPVRFPHC